MAKTGYNTKFLGDKFLIGLPTLSPFQKADTAKTKNGETVLDYTHFSVVMSSSRKFCYYTAVNIDGAHFVDNKREDNWRKDSRLPAATQLGAELYSAKKSDFHRGHMVKREYPSWGTKEEALKAEDETFFFTNCTPQVDDLNTGTWGFLETQILHKGAIGNNFKICVFTGPVLDENDPNFVTPINGEKIQMPRLFWKIVVWVKSTGRAHAVGFLQGQEELLVKRGLVEFEPGLRGMAAAPKDNFFENIIMKDGSTCQVAIPQIEKITGLKFNWDKVVFPYKKKTPAKLHIRKLKNAKGLDGAPGGIAANYTVVGLTL